MSKGLYILAGLAALALAVGHVVGGGQLVVDPLMAANDLAPEAVWLSYFTWHVGTIIMVMMGLAYLFAAVRIGNRSLVVFSSLMALGFAGLGLSLAIYGNSVLWATPAPYAFGPIGILGFLGALLDRRSPIEGRA